MNLYIILISISGSNRWVRLYFNLRRVFFPSYWKSRFCSELSAISHGNTASLYNRSYNEAYTWQQNFNPNVLANLIEINDVFGKNYCQGQCPNFVLVTVTKWRNWINTGTTPMMSQRKLEILVTFERNKVDPKCYISFSSGFQSLSRGDIAFHT